VVGGGMAGLTAALELAGRYSVTVLEARQRFGGRIHTVRDRAGLPLELGAEFVHGNAPETARFINGAKLRTHEVPDRHWKIEGNRWIELPDFWEQLSCVTDEIDSHQGDQSFARFLSKLRKPREAVALAAGFVEGFHAAPLDNASTQATHLSEESSEEMDGQKQIRIHGGYDRIVEYAVNTCREAGVNLRTGVEVQAIDWTRRPATVIVREESQSEIIADRVIVTLPIGVLKGGAIQFSPVPESKVAAIESLEMGIVTKIVLCFREPFWSEMNFGFVHSNDEWFPTWWADERGNILTGWAGGPHGEKLARNDTDFITHRGLESAAKIFGERLPRVRELLVGAYTHNWQRDPSSRGAYSYVPVNATGACHELARPESEALFFAGEATAIDYQFGTVHGAIASGLRAARDLQNKS
jgi:monoamine oxidase